MTQHINRGIPLVFLFLTLSFFGCKEASEVGGSDWKNLNEIGKIASEIEQTYEIESHPYSKIEGYGQIELNVVDPELDHQSIATQISKLKTVQAFDGKLYVAFRHPQDESITPTMWIKYDAKTGKRLEH